MDSNITGLIVTGIIFLTGGTIAAMSLVIRYKLKQEQIKSDTMIRIEQIKAKNQLELEQMMLQDRKSIQPSQPAGTLFTEDERSTREKADC